MGVRYYFALEHDGDNPERLDFIGDLEEVCRSYFVDWRDLHGNSIMTKYPDKKHSLHTEKMDEEGNPFWCCWGLCEISHQIKKLISDIKTDKELWEHEKDTLKDAADGLQLLHRYATEMCVSNKLRPERCYVIWWMHY